MYFTAALLDENRTLGELVRDADDSVEVPTCPGWTVQQLFRHVGRGHRWAAQIVEDRRTEPLSPRDVRDGKPPEDPDAAIDWLYGGAERLIDAVQTTGEDTPVWTFVGPRPAAWWIRRRAHEVLVHRADAAIALGREFDVAPAMAADGVTEWFEIVLGIGAQPTPLDPGTSLHLHATDDGLGDSGEWLLENADGRLAMSRGHAKGTVAVRGTAENLLLGVTRRIAADDPQLDVVGDSQVWRTWLERTPL
ncbi:maleylpyruvate isomerase family mycothiol-dependent enzyme [Mycobacterium sp. MYCO198283]|uniref:maleylpyruvate isomerase family mycothiol-dependent enzyme n=1 Tax=Mycobacterium sp. MYCO198283 TaxID=2883505 RepID=UPI001E55BC41|nr:maleylpyruvate isomerase family mycothiol-dependent enzyme [Mycobacterium sp. MYCO198283]MCG5432103.1 maleylpyruvate isomerase family mycothiol-dependent enzyme [Mycobacterium sp. MYCO198283]